VSKSHGAIPGTPFNRQGYIQGRALSFQEKETRDRKSPKTFETMCIASPDGVVRLKSGGEDQENNY
jgi:hypothetical protein